MEGFLVDCGKKKKKSTEKRMSAYTVLVTTQKYAEGEKVRFAKTATYSIMRIHFIVKCRIINKKKKKKRTAHNGKEEGNTRKICNTAGW